MVNPSDGGNAEKNEEEEKREHRTDRNTDIQKNK
jgi:hypothetical protein